MDESGPTASILLFLAVLAVEFIFYGFGAALQKINYGAIKEAESERNPGKTRKLLTILDEPVIYINTIQVVTTAGNIVVGFFSLRSLYLFALQLPAKYASGGNDLLIHQPFSFLMSFALV